MKFKVKTFLKNNKGFILVIILLSFFRSAVADWNTVPTGSMKPTIIEGDRILVNKLAYDLRIPFTHISLHQFANPKRGDIIVFDSAVFGKRMVKRVIGLPGDTVEMRDNVLVINGQALGYQVVMHNNDKKKWLEDLYGVQHFIQTQGHSSDQYSSFPKLRVPDEHYLVLGDNRDNSADSRVFGFVPRNEIVGRTKKVIMSLDYGNYYMPRKQRFFQPL